VFVDGEKRTGPSPWKKNLFLQSTGGRRGDLFAVRGGETRCAEVGRGEGRKKKKDSHLI